jgi:hypothetical protein
MIPASKTDPTEWKNHKDFFDKQYSQSSDCNVLRKQLSDINNDISTLQFLRESSANRVGYKDSVKSQIHPAQKYLFLLKQNKEATILSDCQVSLNTASPTVGNATTPNDVVKNEVPTNTSNLETTNTTSNVTDISNNTNTTTIIPKKTGLSEFLTPKNGLIAFGIVLLLVAVYFATKKKTAVKPS